MFWDFPGDLEKWHLLKIVFSVQNTRVSLQFLLQVSHSISRKLSLSQMCSAPGMNWRTLPSVTMLGTWFKISQLELKFQLKEKNFFSPKNAVRYLELCNIPTWDQQVSRGIKPFSRREAASVDCFPTWMKETSSWERSSQDRSRSGFCFFFPN